MSRLMFIETSLRRSPSTEPSASMTWRMRLTSSSARSETFFIGSTFAASRMRRARIADAVNVSERDIRVLVARKIDACNTCHDPSLELLFSVLSRQFSATATAEPALPLTLFVFRVFANHPHYSLAVDDLALVANLLDRCSYFHNSSRSDGRPSSGPPDRVLFAGRGGSAVKLSEAQQLI